MPKYGNHVYVMFMLYLLRCKLLNKNLKQVPMILYISSRLFLSVDVEIWSLVLFSLNEILCCPNTSFNSLIVSDLLQVKRNLTTVVYVSLFIICHQKSKFFVTKCFIIKVHLYAQKMV